jgi:C-terminal processing protease CtpA/Prc
VSEVGIQPDIVVPYDPEQTYDDERLDNQIVAAIQVLKGTYEPQPTPEASETP